MCNVRYWTLEEETKREAKNSVVFLSHNRKYLSLLCSTIATSPKCGKIVIHAQDLRILKSLGFEDP